MTRLGVALTAMVMIASASAAQAKMAFHTYPVLVGAGPHDVYPARDGSVWFTAQAAGKLGRLDPKTGKSDMIALGPDAAPHGVIVGPDGAAWVTDGGQNAIVRVDPATRAVKLFPLRRNAATPISTPRASTAWARSGSPGRMASMEGSIRSRAP